MHQYNIPVERISEKYAQLLSKSGNHQGYLCEIEEVSFLPIKMLKSNQFILVLDGVSDVGNIGAMIRTAYALGVDSIVITGLRKIQQEGIARSSAGAFFDMAIFHHENILDLINTLKTMQFTLYGAAMNGQNINQLGSKNGKIALIMGSEGSGINKKVLNRIDTKVSIPMVHGFDSLNVSVAAGIIINRIKND